MTSLGYNDLNDFEYTVSIYQLWIDQHILLNHYEKALNQTVENNIFFYFELWAN